METKLTAKQVKVRTAQLQKEGWAKGRGGIDRGVIWTTLIKGSEQVFFVAGYRDKEGNVIPPAQRVFEEQRWD